MLPERLHAVASGMEGEGQQVHGRKHPGQIFLPMSEVVGQVIGIILQHVEAFIFDLPTGPRAGYVIREKSR